MEPSAVKTTAFICLYGQLREPQQTFFSIQSLYTRLLSENYNVKIIAHLWHDYYGGLFDSRRSGFKSSKDNLEFFLSNFKPAKVMIEDPRTFTLPPGIFPENFCKRTLSNLISQMNSRRKVRDLIEEYCKENAVTTLDTSPVFMIRTDFRNSIGQDILKEFQDNKDALLMRNEYASNDNFFVFNLFNFLRFFDRIDDYISVCVPINIPIIYNQWCPESIIFQKLKDLDIRVIRSVYIPNFV